MKITPLTGPSNKQTEKTNYDEQVQKSWATKRAKMIEMLNWKPQTLKHFFHHPGSEYVYREIQQKWSKK